MSSDYQTPHYIKFASSDDSGVDDFDIHIAAGQ